MFWLFVNLLLFWFGEDWIGKRVKFGNYESNMFKMLISLVFFLLSILVLWFDV